MNKAEINRILQETKSGYDLVSDKFSETRKHFWRDLEFIRDYTRDGDNVLDFGCGNGRLLKLFSGRNVNYFGTDISEKLINLAKSKYAGEGFKFFKINPSQTSLAFNDNFFNAVYSIAVFHHFPGEEYREKMAKELFRITKPGGYAIIVVWNLWQRRYISGILRNWKNKILEKSSLDWNDCYIAFRNNQREVFLRYHHAFTKHEIIKIFTQAGFRKEAVKIGRNIVFIGKK